VLLFIATMYVVVVDDTRTTTKRLLRPAGVFSSDILTLPLPSLDHLTTASYPPNIISALCWVFV